jgi:hypothetical protein
LSAKQAFHVAKKEQCITVSPAIEIGATMNEAACPRSIASNVDPMMSGIAMRTTLQMARYRKNAPRLVQHAKQLENSA